MRALNFQYRKTDRPTDVLAFPGVLADIGDVVLCLAVAKRQAKEYGGTIREELQRLTVHGVLHLFGYDHETNAKDAKRMFALQEKILRRL
jgi:probable rRNA maturation factor